MIFTGEIYLWSDQHHAHDNCASPNTSKWASGYRDFSSTQEMDQTLIDNANAIVKPQDTLILLGDFCVGASPKTDWYRHYRKQYRCENIHYVRGNHSVLRKHTDKIADLFTSISDYVEFRYRKTLFCCSHYAFRVWNESHRGSINCFGHSHNSLPDIGLRQMDVGVDTFSDTHKKYTPWHIDEIIERLKDRKPHKIDHHQESTT